MMNKYLASQWLVNRGDDSTNDVVDISVVPACRTVTKLLDGLSIEHTTDELVGRHIRSAARPVDSEESQPGAVDAIQVVVGVSQQLTTTQSLTEDISIDEGNSALDKTRFTMLSL